MTINLITSSVSSVSESNTLNQRSSTHMIETKRLILHPLTIDQLSNYCRNDFSLEEELGVKKIRRVVAPELSEALTNTIVPNVSDPRKNYLLCTLWSAISKGRREMVGDICFTDVPNQMGEIEIGYGTHEGFQNKGYMTEIVSGIITWLYNESSVKKVIAHTDKANPASAQVLLKNGFLIAEETGSLNKWVLSVENKSHAEL